MKASAIVSVSSLLLALVGAVPLAAADSEDAMCEVHKDGETKKNASGPCTFSQRQGYIDLRNGTTIRLRPIDKANHYKDDKGNKVVPTVLPDGAHEYRFEGKKIIVKFDTTGAGGSGSPGDAGTPQDLRDLVGDRLVGGELDDQLRSRGYVHASDRVVDPDVWSYWRKGSSGRCVAVHFDAERRVRSIAYEDDSSCKH
jgi:hypothetical protein